ncbi:LOXE3 isomerase, partial [Polyodon spathula]|nr:LOXE3 isomerase [Polyodon spathula]
VHDHWKEDDFFGYQYLNGTNPVLIKQCKQIPANFPVTNHMVSGFLESNSLQEEMEKGNIFLVDYQLLEDVPANTINGHTQYIPAPLCLLYKDPHNKLKPIAIQVPYCILVCIRQLVPGCYVLNTKNFLKLILHFFSTILGNVAHYFFSFAHHFFKMFPLPFRATVVMSFYIQPIKSKAHVSNYIYICGLLHHYYPNDSDVCEDTELQSWIKAIFFEGFQGRIESGIPDSFSTVNDLNKFLTMVLFTCSAQHNAVNNGQFDFCAWMPNACPTLRQPSPTKKGETTRADILESIADISSTVSSLAAVWLLTHPSSDFVKLGCYPEKRFTEKEPTDLISEFQKALDTIDNEIVLRNEGIEPEFTCMCLSLIENSVAI